MRHPPLAAMQSALAALMLVIGASSARGEDHPLVIGPQPGRYTPLDHLEPPGKVAHWNLLAKPSLAGYFQPVRIELPSVGLVSFFAPESREPVLVQAPAQADMLIGPVYRFKISGLPEFPGAELYPTIELTDRLHPPAGREHEFPVPVQFTREEIEAALQDRMVTKVIYLERPQAASVLNQEDGRIITFDAVGHSNLLDAADQLGRPMAILRIGGRTPDPYRDNDLLFGPPAPIRIDPAAAAAP